MPTYEYVCTECQNQWEEIQKISEGPIQECPACKKPSAKRQISGGNFILKGGGWYADLYSSAPKKSSSEGGESKPSTETKKSESTTTPAKTESKSPPSTTPSTKAS